MRMRFLICSMLLATLLLFTCCLFACGEPPCDGHTFGEGVVRRAPTCTEEGLRVYVCTACGKTETEAITPLPHETEIAYDAKGHRTVCRVCDTVVAEESHTGGEPSVTPAAAPCRGAVSAFTCTACPYTWESVGAPTQYHRLRTDAKRESGGQTVYTCLDCGGTLTLGASGKLYDYESTQTTLKNWNSASESAWRSYVATQNGNTLAVLSAAEIKTTTNGTSYHFNGPFTGLNGMDVFVLDFDICAIDGVKLSPVTLNPKDVDNRWPGAILSVRGDGSIADVNGIDVAAPGTVCAERMTHITLVYDTSRGEISYYINGMLLSVTVGEAHIGRKIQYFNFIITEAGVAEDVGRSVCLDNLTLAASTDAVLSSEDECAAMRKKIVEDAEAFLRAEQERKLPALREQIGAFDIERDFGGTALEAFPSWTYKENGKNIAYDVPVRPEEGEHPRLLFTKDDIPAMQAALLRDEAFAARVRLYANSGISYGVLPMPTIQSNGVYNYNSGVLEKIQMKALYYQLTGNEYYGYEAILSIKNYIKTLGIGYFNSDQCRYFGNTVYVAACVYDWCYDLMSDADRLQIRVGVQNKLLKGNSGCYYVDKKGEVRYCDGTTVEGGPAAQKNIAKMEIGFPPTHAGALFGHNSEYQLLRDYMSFSVAIFDEEPSWWEYCGGRFYQQYYPARQYFYSEEAAIYPEGTACYGPWRLVCDMYATWMLYALTDEVIYGDGLRQSAYSFLANETHDREMFGTGDGGAQSLSSTFGSGALMIGYLFRDPVLYANAEALGTGLPLAERVILYSSGVEAAEDRTEGFASVQYNGGHYGQLIVRRSWDDPDTPVVLMKGAGLGNGGHDHNDFGSFQIYYKGMLTTEDGIYDTWGSTHHFYYHVATAAHNTLLVYRRSIFPHSYYNGGQRHLMSAKPNGRQNIDEWMHEGYRMGENTGLAWGYTDEGDVSYAYYRNDLTSAYYTEAVRFFERTMLVVYTGREDVPMVMLVLDEVERRTADCMTSFLLQCVKEPVVDEDAKTVTVVNGGGKLVLQSLLGTEKIYAYGRTSKNGRVDADNATGEERFYLSGIERALPSSAGDTSRAWGHVELRARDGVLSDTLLQLLYVTDADATPTLSVKTLTGDGYVGASVDDTVAVFVTDAEAVGDTLSFSTTGVAKKTYYVGGLDAGEYAVQVGGTKLGSFTVNEGEGVLTFEGRSGKVTVTPISK